MQAPMDERSVLRPGSTCWRKAGADRFALIVDAADYFARLKRAMTEAREQILLIGWDFDTRIRLSFDDDGGDWPNRLGDLINALVARHERLNIHVLKWDLGAIQSLGRGATPLFILDWMTNKRIHLQLDGIHPIGACHHQKIAVIDDAIAFCGGIDITAGRWDTREHLDHDKRRNTPWGFRQPPWHDATAAVDGEAARALGDLARLRWKHAKGEDLLPPPPSRDLWPDGLAPTFRDVEVGIARTQPAHAGEDEAREVEALYLAAIGSAKRLIYIESQYLASQRVAEALERRLAEPQGPEIVIINPCSCEGWLEEEVMSSARSLFMGRMRDADRSGHLRVFYPVAAGGAPIYVHAKVMIVDDHLLKVGSSNLNNRSMGLDTECDLAIEASAERRDLAGAIRGVRHELLAEHLGVEPAEFARQEEGQGGSMIAAIERLRTPGGRTLVPLSPEPIGPAERALVEKRLLDPERARSLAGHLSKLAQTGHVILRKRLGREPGKAAGG